MAYTIMAGVLDRATNVNSPLFIVREASRWNCIWVTAPAPRDMDIVPRYPTATLPAASSGLALEPYLGFSFDRKGPPLLLDDDVVKMEFGVTYKGSMDRCERRHMSVDIARAEAAEVDVERVDAIALTDAANQHSPTDRMRRDGPTATSVNGRCPLPYRNYARGLACST